MLNSCNFLRCYFICPTCSSSVLYFIYPTFHLPTCPTLQLSYIPSVLHFIRSSLYLSYTLSVLYSIFPIHFNCPILHLSFTLSVLDFIHPILHISYTLNLSYTSFVLYFICPILYLSYTSFVLHFICPILHLSYTLSVLYFICPILYLSYTSFVLYFICPTQCDEAHYKQMCTFLKIESFSIFNSVFPCFISMLILQIKDNLHMFKMRGTFIY